MHFHFLYLRYFYGRKQNFLNLDWDLSVLFSFENVLISKQLPFYMHFSLDNEYALCYAIQSTWNLMEKRIWSQFMTQNHIIKQQRRYSLLIAVLPPKVSTAISSSLSQNSHQISSRQPLAAVVTELNKHVLWQTNFIVFS